MRALLLLFFAPVVAIATHETEPLPVVPCGPTVAAPATGWDSAPEVARRVQYLLQARWHDALWRSSYNLRGLEKPSPYATVDDAIAAVAGTEPVVLVNPTDITYRHPTTHMEVRVRPIDGTYSIEATGQLHAFRGTVVGLTDRFDTNLALARAIAREFVAVGNRGRLGSDLRRKIPERRAQHGHTWQKGDLLDAIATFGGERPFIYADGYKVRIVNRTTGVHVLDDPEGQYYRLARSNGVNDVFLDATGKLVLNQDAAGLAKTHFDYRDGETERPSLAGALRYLRGETPDTSTTYRTPKPLAPVSAEVGDFAKATTEPDEKLRVAEVGKLDWATLSGEQRAQLIERASTLVNTWEIGAYIQLAALSGDKAWVPVLEKWIDGWRGFTRGWQTFKRAEAESALRALTF